MAGFSTDLESRLPELFRVEKLIERFGSWVRVETITRVDVEGHSLPVYALTLGSQEATSPVFLVTGGVHGLERVGCHLALEYMNTVARLISWDLMLQSLLEKMRLIFIPAVNPGGMYHKTRCNPNGVDLMRNAPIEADTTYKFLPLVSGHRISPRLPWYRGHAQAAMEPEAAALCHFVRRVLFRAKFSLALDLHSGFGLRDRLWFPYARTRQPFPHISEVYSLIRLFRKAYPNHVYVIEPQSRSYTTHGDLWDYLYDENHSSVAANFFLPLCLEMGSWNWVRKNPRQLFSAHGAFNPVIEHRLQRTMRRHLTLLDFLMRATLAHENWRQLEMSVHQHYEAKAIRLWFKEV